MLPDPAELGTRAAEAKRGQTLVQQIRTAVDKFNDFQELAEMAMDIFDTVNGGLADEAFQMFMEQGRNSLQGLRGDKTAKHHSISKFLGGERAQGLTTLGAGIHRDFHEILHSKLKGLTGLGGLGGRGNGTANWEQFLRRNPAARKEVFRAFLQSSLQVDTKYGGNGMLTLDVLGNFLGGRGGKYFRP